MESSLCVPVSDIEDTTTTPRNRIQEMAHFVDLVYKCWSSICGTCPETVTISIVRRLEGRYPYLSSQDALYITERFDNFNVFETVRDK